MLQWFLTFSALITCLKNPDKPDREFCRNALELSISPKGLQQNRINRIRARIPFYRTLSLFSCPALPLHFGRHERACSRARIRFIRIGCNSLAHMAKRNAPSADLPIRFIRILKTRRHA